MIKLITIFIASTMLLNVLPSHAQDFEVGASVDEFLDEDIYVSTSLGDFVISIYSDIEPSVLSHLDKMVSLGLLNNTRIDGVDPYYYIQMGYRENATRGLTEDQKSFASLVPIPPNRHPHDTYSISLTPTDEKKNAYTSLSIVLGQLESFDEQQYSIGIVSKGQNVIEEIRNVSVNDQLQPNKEISIYSMQWLPNHESLQRYDLNNGSLQLQRKEGLILGALILIILLSALAYLWIKKENVRIRAAFPISVIFVSGFTILVAVGSQVKYWPPYLTILPFVGLLAFYKMMNRMESQ
ncbi:MAG: peptidylprolyl isomerase [Bdellovibrionales bacterium]|nr:peptidylprolyl isomerase [Bdellovibrionales bacterium]